MEKNYSTFFLGGRGTPRTNWKDICKPKRAGGLGFKDLGKQNEAFLMKLGFDLILWPDQLWVQVFHAKYKWEGVIPSSFHATNCYWLWKGVSNIWDEVGNELSGMLAIATVTNSSGDWDCFRSLLSKEVVHRITTQRPLRGWDVNDFPGWRWDQQIYYEIDL